MEQRKLLDQVRDALRLKHYAIRTEARQIIDGMQNLAAAII